MRILHSSLFRALCAVVIGVLLIRRPGDTLVWMTVAIGILFLVSGILSCITYMVARSRYNRSLQNESGVELYDRNGKAIRHRKPFFPIVGIGSIVLGLILAVMPSTFVTYLMYVLGAILIIGGASQLFTLISVARKLRISLFFYILPIVILLTGIYTIMQPGESASLTLIVIGWAMLVYGIVETVNVIKISIGMRRVAKQQEEAAAREAEEAVEVTETDDSAASSSSDASSASADGDEEETL